MKLYKVILNEMQGNGITMVFYLFGKSISKAGKIVKALQLVGECADPRDPEILAKLNSQL